MTNSIFPYNNGIAVNHGNLSCNNKIFKAFESFIPNNSKKKEDYKQARQNLTAAKNQNGQIEKFADYTKSKLGFGISSKVIENEINGGKKNEDEINKIIKNYRRSQENTAQASADIASSAASIYTFFKVKNFTELLTTKLYTINKENINTLLKEEKLNNALIKKFKPFLEKKSTFIALGAIASTVVGSQIKPLILSVNRIGTKQYDANTDESMDKNEIKNANKQARNAKWGANFRNFTTGAINGATVPILSILGPAGVPVYAAVNSLSRYFIGEKEDKNEKNINSYIDNIKNSKVTNSLAAALLLTIGIKEAKYNKIFEENLVKAVKNLEGASQTGNLKMYEKTLSSFDKLEALLFEHNNEIKIIMNRYHDSGDARTAIQELSNQNIFALKFKQIDINGDSLSRALKENCPATRTLDIAQKYVNSQIGENEYTLTKLVGVGTIAETYLAKDKTGKEVCLKMLKDGITEAKILKDKDAFIQMVKNTELYSADEKEFLIKNIENIAEGVLKEVDFTNEMKAAQELAMVTKQAKVVKPIEVKNNIYIMEKADGISLQNLLKELRYSDNGIHLSDSDAKDLMGLYQNVLIEQFSKVSSDGKIIHGDIHPGNIFIDIDALKAGRKNPITLIDTGNTINQNSKNAIRFMRLSKYIDDADVENITKFVLDGAVLPENMTRKEAFEKISKELSTLFFSPNTNIPPVTNDNILKLTESIMQKFNILPADTQGNLLKAKTSAGTSLMDFYETLANTLYNNNKPNSTIENIKMGLDILYQQKKYAFKKSMQEKLNLFMLSPTERMKMKQSETTPDKNSLEYLTYAIKQFKTDKIDGNKINEYFENLMKDMFSV